VKARDSHDYLFAVLLSTIRTLANFVSPLKMPNLLNGVAFITGAGSGIGAATALNLALHGIRKLTLCDVDKIGLGETTSNLKAKFSGIDVLALTVDVTSEQEVEAAIQETVKTFERLDVAINNAGITGPMGQAPYVEYSQWRKVFDVNLHGVWLCQRAEIRQMLKQKYCCPFRKRYMLTLIKNR
jgi:NAD(P)-dependent dehydrogenase (short-subunit alcohol dehydrogenase family)